MVNSQINIGSIPINVAPNDDDQHDANQMVSASNTNYVEQQLDKKDTNEIISGGNTNNASESLDKGNINEFNIVSKAPNDRVNNTPDLEDTEDTVVMSSVIDNRDLWFNNVEPINVTNNGPDYETMLIIQQTKKRKREINLMTWKWDETIEIDNYDADLGLKDNVMTGKTFLYKALLAEVRSHGLIALATASSGVAANNMPGGRTAHSRFKIPLNLDNNSMCNIKKQSGNAQLLKSAKLIIWDEASMAKRQAVEALDRTMQYLTGVRLPFGRKIMVLGGDFRQVLPVVRRGTRAQIVDSSLRMSPLWSLIKNMRLTLNMKALTDPWFSDFLLRVGDET